jgi:hypothetical protein
VGDVILEIDRQPVNSPAAAARALSQRHSGGHLLRIRREEGALFVPLPAE